jgi:hypothetical protein
VRKMKQLYVNFLKYCLLFSVTMISGCGGCTDYSVDLRNGYTLVRTNADSIYIFHENSPYAGIDLLVPPKIVRLNDRHRMLFGLVEVSPDSDFGATTTPGYFVLDTNKNQVWLGLNKTKWLQILKDHGITEEPTLVQPSRFYRVHE